MQGYNLQPLHMPHIVLLHGEEVLQSLILPLMIQGRQLEEYISQQGVVDADTPIECEGFCSLYACTNRLKIVAIDFGWLIGMK